MTNELSYAKATLPSDDDRYTLKLLGIIYCVIGGVELLAIVALTVALRAGALRGSVAPLVVIGSIGVIFGASGIFLLLRRAHWLSFAVAIFICLGFPIGTLLGVWTIIVLNKRGVRMLYEETKSAKAKTY